MKSSKELEQSNQFIEIIKIIVWFVIAVTFIASIIGSILTMLRIPDPMIEAVSIVVGISLISIAVFLENIRIIQLFSILSISILVLVIIK